MEPSVVVGVLWLLFGGTHIGLATRRVRGTIVARLGEHGFTAIFSLVASVSFAVLVGGYATVRGDGAAGIGLGGSAPIRLALVVVIAAGVALALASLVYYPGSTYALFRTASRPEPRGLERITRHPFFVGVALLGVAHALLATRLVGMVFFSFLAVFALLGAHHQDAKLLAERGPSHASFLARSSTVPFAAILAGRQGLVLRELPFGALAGGVAAAWALRQVHSAILSHGGAYVIAGVVGGGFVAGLQSWRRAPGK